MLSTLARVLRLRDESSCSRREPRCAEADPTLAIEAAPELYPPAPFDAELELRPRTCLPLPLSWTEGDEGISAATAAAAAAASLRRKRITCCLASSNWSAVIPWA